MTFITENFSKCNVAYCTPFTNFCRDDAMALKVACVNIES